MVFRFNDGSVFDETVVFTQQRVFTPQSYRLIQRGPAFTEDSAVLLERASGQYRVGTKVHPGGGGWPDLGGLNLHLRRRTTAPRDEAPRG